MRVNISAICKQGSIKITSNSYRMKLLSVQVNKTLTKNIEDNTNKQKKQHTSFDKWK